MDAIVVEAVGGDAFLLPVPEGRRVVGIEGKHVTELAHLISRVADMKASKEYCDQYLAYANKPEFDVACSALWKMAVVSYGRSFARDGRTMGQLSLSALNSVPGNPLGAHKYFLSIRNTFVAHSDSGLEETKIGAVLASDALGVESLYVVHLAAQDLVEGGAVTLKRLADAFIDWAEPISQALQSVVLASTRSQAVAELYARPDLGYRMPTADETVDRGARNRRR